MPGSRALALTTEQTAGPPAAADAAVTTPQAAAPSAAERGRLGRRLLRSKALPRLISPVVVLALWQLVSSAGPGPGGQAAAADRGLAHRVQPGHHQLAGLRHAAGQHAGLAGAVGDRLRRRRLVAMLLALVAGLSRLGENAVDPLLQMLRTLPLFGLIPVFIVWFGIGELPKMLLIALGAAIPLYLNTFAGIRGVDASSAELGRVLGCAGASLIRHIVLPGALPQALIGLRQSLGVAWLALVVAEQVNANAGLGFMISQATQFLRNDVIFVRCRVRVLGLLTDALVRLLERRALAWRRSFGYRVATPRPRSPVARPDPPFGGRTVLDAWTWTSRRASSSP